MSSKATVGKLESYLKKEDKTEEKLISGMNCNSNNFAKECQATNLLYRKNNEKGERKYYHVVQSFSPKDNGKLTPEQAHEIGRQFAEKNFKGHEVLVVTHTDKEHIHNHFVLNSVSIDNGKKYRADNKSLWKLRKDSNDLCKSNGLTHSIQDLDKKANDKYKSGEVRKAERGEDVWKMNLKAQIETTAKTATSFEQFKSELSQKFKVDVQERTRKSKGKTESLYEYKPEGNKKYCGEHRLGTDYGKENIDGRIRRNQEKARTESTRNTGAEPRGITHGIDTRNLESEIRSRQTELTEFELGQREHEFAKQDKNNQRDGKGNQNTKGQDRKIKNSQHEH